MSGALLQTAFHIRTAEHNSANAWVTRSGFTVPAYYGDPQQEALAARFSCVLADVSATEELKFEGQGAASLLAAGFGPELRTLQIGQSQVVFWCSEGGGLRGVGTMARLADDGFALSGADCDAGWFAPQASRFNASVRDTAVERGVLLLAGPFARAILTAAGMEPAADLEPERCVEHHWSGMSVLLSREPRLNTYRIACPAKAGIAVFDHLMKAGRMAGLRLAGQQAVDLLSLEAGMPITHLDFTPARSADARAPLPSAFGLGPQSLEGERILAGVEFKGAEPYPFALIRHGAAQIGRTLRSAYSLALKRAIALAQLEPKFAVPGTVLRVRVQRRQGEEDVEARVVALPFL